MAEKENTTVHTATRALYERFVLKLIKTNCVFTISTTRHYEDRPADEQKPLAVHDAILIHPFLGNPGVEASKFLCKSEAKAKKYGVDPNWSVHVHEGSPAAYKLLRLFNRALVLMKNPQE